MSSLYPTLLFLMALFNHFLTETIEPRMASDTSGNPFVLGFRYIIFVATVVVLMCSFMVPFFLNKIGKPYLLERDCCQVSEGCVYCAYFAWLFFLLVTGYVIETYLDHWVWLSLPAVLIILDLCSPCWSPTPSILKGYWKYWISTD